VLFADTCRPALSSGCVRLGCGLRAGARRCLTLADVSAGCWGSGYGSNFQVMVLCQVQYTVTIGRVARCGGGAFCQPCNRASKCGARTGPLQTGTARPPVTPHQGPARCGFHMPRLRGGSHARHSTPAGSAPCQHNFSQPGWDWSFLAGHVPNSRRLNSIAGMRACTFLDQDLSVPSMVRSTAIARAPQRALQGWLDLLHIYGL
jgi:hypothetical protein